MADLAWSKVTALPGYESFWCAGVPVCAVYQERGDGGMPTDWAGDSGDTVTHARIHSKPVMLGEMPSALERNS